VDALRWAYVRQWHHDVEQLTPTVLARAFSMSTFDPSDPFNLLPPPRPQPPPSLIDTLLRKSAEPTPPEKLKQIETILKSYPYGSASSTIAPASTASISQKSIAQKLRDHLTLGFRLLSENKLTKGSGTQWISRLKALLQPLFGSAPYIKNLEELRKKCATSGLTKEEFSNTLAVANDFADFLDATGGSSSGYPASRASRPPATKSVLIIHGRDELNTRRLSDYLREDEGVMPIVMMAQPGMSRPLTDKFEDEASKCAFAFALFTADDIVKSGSEQYQQARPNVIYETGWFIARLGKKRTVLLLQSGAEMHTDLQGVSRIHFEQDVREKCQDIHRELKAAGLTS
jgi:predicted nucleotide-binding protein